MAHQRGHVGPTAPTQVEQVFGKAPTAFNRLSPELARLSPTALQAALVQNQADIAAYNARLRSGISTTAAGTGTSTGNQYWYDPQTGKQYLPGQDVPGTRTTTQKAEILGRGGISGRVLTTSSFTQADTLKTGYAPKKAGPTQSVTAQTSQRGKVAKQNVLQAGVVPYQKKNPFLAPSPTENPNLFGINIV